MSSTNSDEKQRKGIVYQAKNDTNNKLYIGITTRRLEERIAEHKYDSFNRVNSNMTYFHRAIHKYGINHFSFEILETVYSDNKTELIHKLNKLERYYIQKYDTKNKNKGYNLTDGGEGVSGYKLTPEHRAIVSKTHKGKSLSDEHKARIREFMRSDKNPNIGRHQSDEAKRKISEANKGRLAGDKNPMYGKKRPDLTQRNIDSGYRVCQISPITYEIINRWDSLRAASRDTGYARSCIADCCKHKTKLCHGYIWEYELKLNEQKEAV